MMVLEVVHLLICLFLAVMGAELVWWGWTAQEWWALPLAAWYGWIVVSMLRDRLRAHAGRLI